MSAAARSVPTPRQRPSYDMTLFRSDRCYRSPCYTVLTSLPALGLKRPHVHDNNVEAGRGAGGLLRTMRCGFRPHRSPFTPLVPTLETLTPRVPPRFLAAWPFPSLDRCTLHWSTGLGSSAARSECKPRLGDEGEVVVRDDRVLSLESGGQDRARHARAVSQARPMME